MKIKVIIQTDKIGSACEEIIDVDDEEWNEMNDDEKEEYCKETAFSMTEWSFCEI